MPRRLKLLRRVRIDRLAVLTAAAVALALVAEPLSAQPGRPARAKPKPAPDPFLQGDPFTKEHVLQMVEGFAAGAFREERIIEGVRARGVDFVFTPELEGALRGAGASDRVLSEIRAKAKAPPPPPPPPPAPKLGSLAVSCLPAECEVSINGGPARTTKDGRLLLTELQAGKAYIDFRREGYIGQQGEVVIGAGRSELSVRLEPTQETQARIGAALLNEMLAALGVSRNLGKYGEIVGAGTATTTDGGGGVQAWDVDFRLTPPALAQLQASNPAGSLTLLCRGEKCDVRNGGGRLFGGKRLRAEEAAKLVDNLHLFRRNNIRKVLERLLAPGMKVTAAAPAKAGEERRITFKVAHESYEVTTGPDGLPSLVAFRSETAPSSGSRYLFTDYAAVGGTKYPRRTEIRLADSKQGIAVRFEKAEAAPTLRDRDFPR